MDTATPTKQNVNDKELDPTKPQSSLFGRKECGLYYVLCLVSSETICVVHIFFFSFPLVVISRRWCLPVALSMYNQTTNLETEVTHLKKQLSTNRSYSITLEGKNRELQRSNMIATQRIEQLEMELQRKEKSVVYLSHSVNFQ
jgi:hypothetical protein